MSRASEGQAYQTIAPAWVARALLIDPAAGNPAFAKLADACWTSDLPEQEQFNNEFPACVITDVGSDTSRRNNTANYEGILAIRVFGGTRDISDCWLAWHAIKARLTNSDGIEVTVNELQMRARWLWAFEAASPIEIRKHPVTQWPELNCTLEYAVQGIQKEI